MTARTTDGDAVARAESRFQLAAERAVRTTVLALVDERDRLRGEVERYEREKTRLNETLHSETEGATALRRRYDSLRTRRSVRIALAVSRLARRPIHRRNG